MRLFSFMYTTILTRSKFVKIEKQRSRSLLKSSWAELSTFLSTRKTRLVSPLSLLVRVLISDTRYLARTIFCTFSFNGRKYNFLSASGHVNVFHAPSTSRGKSENPIQLADSRICFFEGPNSHANCFSRLGRIRVRSIKALWDIRHILGESSRCFRPGNIGKGQQSEIAFDTIFSHIDCLADASRRF